LFIIVNCLVAELIIAYRARAEQVPRKHPASTTQFAQQVKMAAGSWL